MKSKPEKQLQLNLMKACVHYRYGGPEVIEVKEIPIPEMKENELLIKVKASTVNRTDCALLRAKPFIMRFIAGLFKPKRIVSGTDFAGIVEKTGKMVTKFSPGDRIFGFDDDGLSSHAEYLVISEDNAMEKIPENIEFDAAAASIEGAHYAINFVNKVPLKKGDSVLINGASGAIGTAAVQLCKFHKATVTAVCNTQNIETVKSIGANHVIDYTKEDFTNTSQRFDYIFDTVGKSSFGICQNLLKPGGIYISSELGKNGQNLLLSILKPLMKKKKVYFPFPVNRQNSVNLLRDLMNKNYFFPVIDRHYTFHDIQHAFRYVESGQKSGNVVLIPE